MSQIEKVSDRDCEPFPVGAFNKDCSIPEGTNPPMYIIRGGNHPSKFYYYEWTTEKIDGGTWGYKCQYMPGTQDGVAGWYDYRLKCENDNFDDSPVSLKKRIAWLAEIYEPDYHIRELGDEEKKEIYQKRAEEIFWFINQEVKETTDDLIIRTVENGRGCVKG